MISPPAPSEAAAAADAIVPLQAPISLANFVTGVEVTSINDLAQEQTNVEPHPLSLSLSLSITRQVAKRQGASPNSDLWIGGRTNAPFPPALAEQPAVKIHVTTISTSIAIRVTLQYQLLQPLNPNGHKLNLNAKEGGHLHADVHTRKKTVLRGVRVPFNR
jgi:hypothetical protein